VLKKILVPLDGSELARRALPYAARLARLANGRVVLMRAAWTYTLPTEGLSRSERAIREWIERDLDEEAGRLAAQGVDADARIAAGPPESAIAEAARRENADTIVMSSHGRAGLGRWVFGSVAEAVLRTADVPVLIVPAGAADWAVGRPGPVVTALGDADLAEDALAPALELAAALGTGLRLVRVVAPVDRVQTYVQTNVDGQIAVAVPGPGGAPAAAWLDEEQERLDDLATRLRGRGVPIETTLAVGDPAGEIARVARETGAGAIAMATHRRGEVARLVVGSVAMTVLSRAGLPTLLVRPRVAARPRAAAAADLLAPVGPPHRAGPATLRLEPDELELLSCGLNRLLDTSLPDQELEDQAYALLSRLRRARHAAEQTTSPSTAAMGSGER
jgi:nucleotide-binding universal stress UspA family protein